jgi:hypothetical protein
MFKVMADYRSLFELKVLGERLRQLLSLRIQRITGAIEREQKLVAELRAIEDAQRAHDERIAALQAEQVRRPIPRGAGAHTIADLDGYVGYVGCGPRAVEPAAARHDKNVRALGNALAEIRWLHDEIDPSAVYQLSRGDLSLFGDFDIPGSGIAQIGGLGEDLA